MLLSFMLVILTRRACWIWIANHDQTLRDDSWVLQHAIHRRYSWIIIDFMDSQYTCAWKMPKCKCTWCTRAWPMRVPKSYFAEFHRDWWAKSWHILVISSLVQFLQRNNDQQRIHWIFWEIKFFSWKNQLDWLSVTQFKYKVQSKV